MVPLAVRYSALTAFAAVRLHYKGTGSDERCCTSVSPCGAHLPMLLRVLVPRDGIKPPTSAFDRGTLTLSYPGTTDNDLSRKPLSGVRRSLLSYVPKRYG